MSLRDRVRQLELGAVGSATAVALAKQAKTTGGPVPPVEVRGKGSEMEPSAPPAPEELFGHEGKKTK